MTYTISRRIICTAASWRRNASRVSRNLVRKRGDAAVLCFRTLQQKKASATLGKAQHPASPFAQTYQQTHMSGMPTIVRTPAVSYYEIYSSSSKQLAVNSSDLPIAANLKFQHWCPALIQHLSRLLFSAICSPAKMLTRPSLFSLSSHKQSCHTHASNRSKRRSTR